MTGDLAGNAAARLAALLRPQPENADRFRADAGSLGYMRLYGGQLVAQALAAAYRTVAPDRACHSLQTYFVRPGQFDVPLTLDVSRDRDGRSFSSRRVTMTQGDSLLLTMQASFQIVEGGPTHDLDAMPSAPDPETLPTVAERAIAMGRTPPPINILDTMDVRPISGGLPFDPAHRTPDASFWFRFPALRTDDPAFDHLLIAYASDLFLLNAAVHPHRRGQDDRFSVASLDHLLWFHGAGSAADWMLYTQESRWSGSGRGLARGAIFARDGRRLATVTQEGLIRMAGETAA